MRVHARTRGLAARAPTRGAPTGPGRCCSGLFFAVLGLSRVGVKSFFCSKFSPIFERKQCVRFVQDPGQPPVRVCVYPGLGSRLSIPPWNGGRPGFDFQWARLRPRPLLAVGNIILERCTRSPAKRICPRHSLCVGEGGGRCASLVPPQTKGRAQRAATRAAPTFLWWGALLARVCRGRGPGRGGMAATA